MPLVFYFRTKIFPTCRFLGSVLGVEEGEVLVFECLVGRTFAAVRPQAVLVQVVFGKRVCRARQVAMVVSALGFSDKGAV